MVTCFLPGRMTLERYLGLPADITIDEAARSELPLRRWVLHTRTDSTDSGLRSRPCPLHRSWRGARGRFGGDRGIQTAHRPPGPNRGAPYARSRRPGGNDTTHPLPLRLLCDLPAAASRAVPPRPQPSSHPTPVAGVSLPEFARSAKFSRRPRASSIGRVAQSSGGAAQAESAANAEVGAAQAVSPRRSGAQPSPRRH